MKLLLWSFHLVAISFSVTKSVHNLESIYTEVSEVIESVFYLFIAATF